MASVPHKTQRPKRRQAPQADSIPRNRQEQATQTQVTQTQAPVAPEAPPTRGGAMKRVIGAGDVIYLIGVVTAAMVSGIVLLLWLVGR